jgi:hypothetical protein
MTILRFSERLMRDKTGVPGWLTFLAVFLFAVQAMAIEIPLQKQGGVYSLPVRINGVITLDFILDSGASEVTIPADVALTLLRAGTISGGDFLDSYAFRNSSVDPVIEGCKTLVLALGGESVGSRRALRRHEEHEEIFREKQHGFRI